MDWELLIDRHKHRIVKRGGMWRMYCPQRGADDLIYATDWRWVMALIRNRPQCPHEFDGWRYWRG